MTNSSRRRTKTTTKTTANKTVAPKVEEEVKVTEPTPEIEPKPETTQTVAEEPTPTPEIEEKKVEVTGSVKFNFAMDTIAKYVEVMDPTKSNTVETCAVQGKALYFAIRDILGLEGSEFEQAMNLLLKIINENRQGCFDERYMFRGWSEIALNKLQRKEAENLLSLFITVCNPKDRVIGLRSIDLTVVGESIRNEVMAQKLINFFSAV